MHNRNLGYSFYYPTIPNPTHPDPWPLTHAANAVLTKADKDVRYDPRRPQKVCRTGNPPVYLLRMQQASPDLIVGRPFKLLFLCGLHGFRLRQPKDGFPQQAYSHCPPSCRVVRPCYFTFSRFQLYLRLRLPLPHLYTRDAPAPG